MIALHDFCLWLGKHRLLYLILLISFCLYCPLFWRSPFRVLVAFALIHGARAGGALECSITRPTFVTSGPVAAHRSSRVRVPSPLAPPHRHHCRRGLRRGGATAPPRLLIPAVSARRPLENWRLFESSPGAGLDDVVSVREQVDGDWRC